MKKVILPVILILAVGAGFIASTQDKVKPKIPHAGGNITPEEAYDMLKEDPEHTFLIDNRTMAEYEFVGHPPTAYNIPYKYWTPAGLESNVGFVGEVEKKFKKTDRLLLICRSGKRSCHGANKLIKAGFKNVFNVLYGFEGDKVKDVNSPHYGHRGYLNGWRRDRLPYTYKLEKKYANELHTSCGCD